MTPGSPGDGEPLPELLAEIDPYPAIREALERRVAAGASHGEAVRQVAAELDEEDRREMIELGLSCIVLGTFD